MTFAVLLLGFHILLNFKLCCFNKSVTFSGLSYFLLTLECLGFISLFSVKFLLVFYQSSLDHISDKKVLKRIRKSCVITASVFVMFDWIILENIKNSTNFNLVQGNFTKTIHDGLFCSLTMTIFLAWGIFVQFKIKFKFLTEDSHRCLTFIPMISFMSKGPNISDGIVEILSTLGCFVLLILYVCSLFILPMTVENSGIFDCLFAGVANGILVSFIVQTKNIINYLNLKSSQMM